MSRFKVGDIVVCEDVDNMEAYLKLEKRYEVTSIEWGDRQPAPEREILRVRPLGTAGMIYRAFARRFRPATPRFKVGDRVVCIRGDSDMRLYGGQEYTVEGVDRNSATQDLIGVRAGGCILYILHNRFKPAPEKPRFKTGDLVVCTNAERMEDHVTEGAHYVVVSTEWNAVWPAHERETLQVREVDTLGPMPCAYAHRFEPVTETKEEMLLKTVTDLRERLAVTRHSERTKVEYINYLRENNLIRDGRPEPKVEREPDVEACPRPETLAWLGACPEDTVRSLTYYVDDVRIEYKEDRR